MEIVEKTGTSCRRLCNPDFSIYFQWFVAKIEYFGLHLLSIHPKSSFWMHAVAVLYPICRAHDASVEIKTWSSYDVSAEIETLSHGHVVTIWMFPSGISRALLLLRRIDVPF